MIPLKEMAFKDVKSTHLMIILFGEGYANKTRRNKNFTKQEIAS